MNVSNMKYFAKFSPAYETLELMSATKPMEVIEPSTMNVIGIEFGQKTQISNCNSNIKKMTPCVKKWYETNFGTGYESMVSSTFNSSFSGLKGLEELHKGLKFIFSFLKYLLTTRLKKLICLITTTHSKKKLFYIIQRLCTNTFICLCGNNLHYRFYFLYHKCHVYTKYAC